MNETFRIIIFVSSIWVLSWAIANIIVGICKIIWKEYKSTDKGGAR